MGSGKSTIGNIIAKRIGYSYIDVDKRIEEKTGRTISDIFRKDGENTFRRIEAAVLKDVLKSTAAVISCGGGIVIQKENRRLLKQGSLVVYLKAEPEEIYRRVGNTGRERPLLKVDDPQAEINRLLKEREPVYQEVADIVVDTTGRTASEAAELVIKELELRDYRQRC